MSSPRLWFDRGGHRRQACAWPRRPLSRAHRLSHNKRKNSRIPIAPTTCGNQFLAITACMVDSIAAATRTVKNMGGNPPGPRNQSFSFTYNSDFRNQAF